MGTFSTLIGQYLEPARVLPPDATSLRKIAGSLRSSFTAGDTAALPSAVGFEIERELVFMPKEQFSSLYDQIRPAYLSFGACGEATLHGHLAEMVAHATAGGTRVQVVTHGALLTPERASRLLNADLGKLKVSIDGAEPAVYAKYRPGGDLEVVLRNVERLVAMRDARRLSVPVVELQMVLFREDLDQAEKLVDLCRTRFPGVTPNFLMGRAGLVARAIQPGDSEAVRILGRARDLAAAFGFRRAATSLSHGIVEVTTDLSSAPCFVPWYSCMISTDGAVYPCCYHTVRGVSVGNACTSPFAAVWNGPRMAEFRRALRTRRCDDAVCAACTYDDRGMDRVFGLFR